jgi:hypothetical protein
MTSMTTPSRHQRNFFGPDDRPPEARRRDGRREVSARSGASLVIVIRGRHSLLFGERHSHDRVDVYDPVFHHGAASMLTASHALTGLGPALPTPVSRARYPDDLRKIPGKRGCA